ncbi:MAG TPA: phosphodiester glycosidase family protein [Gaiellaceae bacterium]|nr:phosphodiester glycosidase family protein [Gaiellaceae bacterium]
MVRRLLVAIVLAGALAPAAAAEPVQLMPGVVYEKQVQFTPHGPEVIHVMTAPRPSGLYALRPVLSNGALLGRETVTSMQRRVSSIATVGGVNGDLFTFAEGLPSGMLMQSGVLKTPPHPRRSSVGITSDGRLAVDRVALIGQWQGSSQRRPLNGLNQRPGPEGASLFTPAWGSATPFAQGTVEVVLQPFPPASAFTELTGSVVAAKPGGGTAIPADGAVLVARGSSAGRLAAEAQLGQEVTVRLILRPQWGGITEAIGGGPLIVKDGQPVFRALEDFSSGQLNLRHPRTAVGQRADGTVILVAVDGRRPGYSVGMTNFELAQTMVRLGAATASALDAGGSTTMAFDGTLLNRPSERFERPVSDALMVFYYGVYAPLPSAKVLSPNGDGVDEVQSLSYKLVRRSTVTASLIGPDRVPREIETGVQEPGVHRLTWSGRRGEGSLEPEGRWRWVINALDDEGKESKAERAFFLNNTLGYLQVRPSRLVLRRRGGALHVGFRLARPAVVTLTVETASGARVRTITRRMRAGRASIRWNGRYRNGARAFSGSYVARVRTSSSSGPAELARRFSVRRVR